MTSKEQNLADNIQEEVFEGDWNCPAIDLKEVPINTGEEDEEVMWKCRSKLYRWANPEWKERGIGDSKLLKHKKTNRIRFLLRQEKTLKIVANHYVIQSGTTLCKLLPHASNDKIWLWSVYDNAEEVPKLEHFALKFGTITAATEFKEKFMEAVQLNAKAFNIEAPKKTEVKTNNNDDSKDEKKDEKTEEKKDEKPAEEERDDKPHPKEKLEEEQSKTEEVEKKEPEEKKDEA